MFTATEYGLIAVGLIAAVAFGIMAARSKKPQTMGVFGTLAVAGTMVVGFIVVPALFEPGEVVQPPITIVGAADWVNIDLTENTTFIEEGNDDGVTIFFDVPAIFNQTSNLFEQSTGTVQIYLLFENNGLNDGSKVKVDVTQVGQWIDDSGPTDDQYYIINKMDSDFLFNWTEEGSTITSELSGPSIPDNTDDSSGWFVINFTLNPTTFDLMSQGDNADSHTIIQFTNTLTGDLIRELVFDIELDTVTT